MYTDTDAPRQAGFIHAMACTAVRRIGWTAVLGAAMSMAPAWAGQPVTFALDVSGFNDNVVANDQGRLIQDWPGRSWRLTEGHWISVDYTTKSSVWFDDAGHVSLRGPYVEIRSDALVRHPDDPDQSPLFSVWAQDGTALLHADGRVFIDWQPEQDGKWTITAHPQRYSWSSPSTGERIFDERGQLRMQLEADQERIAGPFEGRLQYLICPASREEPCVLRDEAGAALWRKQLDDLLPLQDGGWLGRWGNAWRRLDSKGQLAGDRTRIYAGRRFLLHMRRTVGEDMPRWPRWMSEYRLEYKDNGAILLNPDSAVAGLMQADGRFVPIPGATSGREVCPGVWRFESADGARLGLANGLLVADAKAFSWWKLEGWELEGWPEMRVATATDGQKTLIDCQERTLVNTPPLSNLTADATGLLGTLVGESQPRLWLDAHLQQHLLPEGFKIETSSRDGALLAVQSIDNVGVFRLYNVQRDQFVGDEFRYVEALLPGGVVFLRGGYYGFMDGDGNERLAPRYNKIIPWGEDRLWSRRDPDKNKDESSSELVSLHRMDGSVINSWLDATVHDNPILRQLPDQGPVTALSWSFKTAQGSYFGQQWLNRDGRSLFLAMTCKGTSADTEGAVLEPLTGPPRHHGANCSIPDPLRAAMAALPANGQAVQVQEPADVAAPGSGTP